MRHGQASMPQAAEPELVEGLGLRPDST